MRSLVILDRLPYPPIGGQQLRYRQAIEALRGLGPVTLLLLARAAPEPAPDAAPPWVRFEPEVSHGWLYRAGRWLGPRGKKAWRARLRARHLQGLRVQIAALLERTGPDLVLVENPELVACLPPLAAPGRRVVYDAHNVERILWGELAALRGRLGAGSGNAAFAQRILAGEAALVVAADQIWACSEEDAARFPAVYPGPLPEIWVVPNAVDTEAFAAVAQARAAGRPGGAPPVVLFTGNFGYAPNLEAARILLHEVRPRLLPEVPDLELVLCGRGPPPELRAMAAAEPSILVTGEVADARPWFARADVVAVPLRTGSGTRLKILEAMAAGCPVVSTRKGAEGLRLEPERHLLLADTPDELAAAVLRCLREPEAAGAMAARGREQVERLYSWRANAARVREALGLG